MKHLNRKEYKKTIKRFRESCPLARVQGHWVYMTDEDHSAVLMYVDNSVVKRVGKKDRWSRKYHCFEFEGYQFYLMLYGSPTLKYSWKGLEERTYVPDLIIMNKDCQYALLNDDEVEACFEHMMFLFKTGKKDAYCPEFKKNMI